MSEKCYFSLLVCTCNRVVELKRLLDSLREQNFSDWELLIIDQNADDRVDSLRQEYVDLPIIYRRAPINGLSFQRNKALNLAQGRFCAFPDDDCYLAPGLLRGVHDKLEKSAADGLCLRVASELDENSAGGIMGRQSWKQVNRRNVFTCVNSSGMFIRRTALLEAGGFAENLGVNPRGIYQSSEDTEVVLKIMARGGRIFYCGTQVVYHPVIAWTGDQPRAWKYGCGRGKVLADYHYPTAFFGVVAAWQLWSMVRAWAAKSLEASFHYYMFRGEVYGFFKNYRIGSEVWSILLVVIILATLIGMC